MVLRPPTQPAASEQTQPDQSRRPRAGWLLAGLLALLLLAVGVGVGRLSTPSSPSPPIAVVVDDGVNGHTRLTADVPVGYAHTEQGAVSAATNYLASLAKATVSNQPTRDQMIAALAAEGSRAALQQQYDWASAEVGRDLHLERPESVQAVVRMIPVGWQLIRYDGRTAEVLVFGTGLYGSSAGVPVRETWGVNTVTLTWENGDWKLVSSTTEPAIVPLADARSRVASDNGTGLAPLVNRFQEYRYGS
jgi:hypothetical protein